MQTEKEFKELAQAWAQDKENMILDCQLEEVMQLMWRSYNQGEQDKIQDANEIWEQCKNEKA